MCHQGMLNTIDGLDLGGFGIHPIDHLAFLNFCKYFLVFLA